MKRSSLIYIIITLALLIICLVALVILCFYNQNFPSKQGVIVGEVVGVHRDYAVYIKPIGNTGTKHLLEFELSTNTTFASGPVVESFAQMPELAPGAVIEISYTFTPYSRDYYLGITTIDSIKVAESTSSVEEWPKLILNEDFDWNRPSDGMRMKGEVMYVATLDEPISGYIVYVKNDSVVHWGKYFIKTDNIFLTDELRELLDRKSIGYIIDITALGHGVPFENSSIYGTFVVELLSE